MTVSPLEVTKSLFWNKANQFYFTVVAGSGGPALPVSDDVLMAAVTSIEIPDVTNENFEEYIAGMFYKAYGRNSIYQLTVTFKDIWPNTLYSYFNNYLVMSRKKYTDDVKWSLTMNTTWPGGPLNTILKIDDALLIGVSNLSFDQSNDQILEFSCTWKFSLFNQEGILRESSV